jgi:hypothetical protein
MSDSDSEFDAAWCGDSLAPRSEDEREYEPKVEDTEMLDKKRKAGTEDKKTSTSKKQKDDPLGRHHRYYPTWDVTKPIPPNFFGCITEVIQRAHFATSFPPRGDLGVMSSLPLDVLEKIVNFTPWTRTRFLLCAGNRFLRFLAARKSDARNVLVVADSPEIRKACRHYTEVYNAVARAAVVMDSPWIVLRFVATANDTHRYAPGRCAFSMAIAAVELRCLDIIRLELKFGLGKFKPWKNYKEKVSLGDSYRLDISSMLPCLHSCLVRAINLKLEDTAFGLFYMVNEHNAYIKQARKEQNTSKGGVPVKAWPDGKQLITYLRYACDKGLWRLARYLVEERGATLASPARLIKEPKFIEPTLVSDPTIYDIKFFQERKAKVDARREEHKKMASMAREFHEWYKKRAVKHKPVPRPKKVVCHPLG